MSVFFCFRCVLITNALCHLCGVATVMHSASSKKENKLESKHFWSSGQTLYTQTRLPCIFFASFPWKQVKVYWLARMGQNFDQAKRDNTFWPRPNILKNVVFLSQPFFSEFFFLTWKRQLPWRMAKILKMSWLTSLILNLQPHRSSSNLGQHRLSSLTSLY